MGQMYGLGTSTVLSTWDWKPRSSVSHRSLGDSDIKAKSRSQFPGHLRVKLQHVSWLQDIKMLFPPEFSLDPLPTNPTTRLNCAGPGRVSGDTEA